MRNSFDEIVACAQTSDYLNLVDANDKVPFNIAEFERLSDLRGWTDDKLRAANIGISGSTISRLRSGKYHPSAKFINRTLAALQVPYGVLFSKPAEQPDGRAA